MQYEGHEAGWEVLMAEGAVRRSGPRSTIFQRTGRQYVSENKGGGSRDGMV